MPAPPEIAALPFDERVRMAQEARQRLREYWLTLPQDQYPDVPAVEDRIDDHFGIGYGGKKGEDIFDVLDPTAPVDMPAPEPLPAPEPVPTPEPEPAPPEPEISDRDPEPEAEETECGFWCAVKNIGIGVAKGIAGAVVGAAVTAALVFVGVPAAVLTAVGAVLGLVGAAYGVYTAYYGTLQEACQVLGEMIVGLGLPRLLSGVANRIRGRGQTKPQDEPPPNGPIEDSPPKSPLDEPPPRSPPDESPPRPDPNEPAPGPKPPRLPKRVEELAKDPLNNNKISPKSIKEAEVGAGLESDGRVPGPLNRDPSGAGEFIDAKGQTWDVKGYNSQFKNGFKLDKAVAQIEGEMRLGENVMVDTRTMTAEHVGHLMEAASIRGWGDRVIFYP